ncbi:MAG: AAA family ATPase [Ruminococcus sp.]|nr:AAA family ATPase [Ruminococcus sp.]
MTGCLRISKESIFTGLNNLSVHSVTDNLFASYFGFTESEVREILEYYNLSDCFDKIKKWYDGYLFGETEIYNP